MTGRVWRFVWVWLLLAAGVLHAQNTSQPTPPPMLLPVLPPLTFTPENLLGENRTLTQALLNCGPDRSVGTPGGQQSLELLAQTLHQATGQTVWRQRFTCTIPELEVCWAADAAHPETHLGLWPLTPSGAQPAALPGGQATAPVCYVGKGTLPELRGKPIAHAWVALDLDSQTAWETLGGLGARGIIFLGASDSTQNTSRQFLDKSTVVPLGLPRFYTDDPALVAGLKSATIQTLTVRVQITWRQRTTANLLCYLPAPVSPVGASATPAGASPTSPGDFNHHLIVLQTSADATSQVLGRAPGATRAQNAAALVQLAGAVAQLPRHAPVLIALTSGDEWLLQGNRQLMEFLQPTLSANQALYNQQARVVKHQLTVDNTRNVVTILDRLKDANLERATVLLRDPSACAALRDALERKTSQVELELQNLRQNAAPAAHSPPPPRSLEQLNLDKRKQVDAITALTQQDNLLHSLPLLIVTAREILPLWQAEAVRQQELLTFQKEWLGFRHALGADIPILQIGLDLSGGALSGSAGGKAGGFARSQFSGLNDLAGRMSLVNRALGRYLAEGRKDQPDFAAAFDPRSTQSAYTLESFFPQPRAFATDAALAAGLPAMTFATIADAAGAARLDTPYDLGDPLSGPQFEPQIRMVYALLLGADPLAARPRASGLGLLIDPDLDTRADLAADTSAQPVTVLERTVGETIPRLGAAQQLVGMEQIVTRANLPLPRIAGLRPVTWELTALSGHAEFLQLARHAHRLQAFGFDSDGLINRAQYQPTNPIMDPDSGQQRRVVMFQAIRLDLFGLFDPRYQDYLDRLDLLDARRQDRVPYAYTQAAQGLGVAFMPPGTCWQLLVSRGDTANRMILINAQPGHPQGIGFSTVDLAEIGPLAWRNALDLFALDTKRQRDLESFGITNQIIQDFHGTVPKSASAATAPHANPSLIGAAEYLERARTAKAQGDIAGWLANAQAAWSMEISVYQNLQDTSNGIIRGVVFLLLGIIPFSYFLERLLIGAVNVYRQIAGFAAIFLLMTGLLWFHPAFRISSAPIMILLAFFILILSSTVVWILMGKFEEEISRLRGAALAAHTESIRRSAMLWAAIRLGLSNMRRRGTRTVLTLITLVLLTFTLLCFTSVREAVRLTPQNLTRAPAGQPPGIMLRNFAWRTIEAPTETLVHELAPTGPTARRYWYSSERADPQLWQLPIVGVATKGSEIGKYQVSALLGLESAEAEFTAHLTEALPGFTAFASNPAVCLLPLEARETGHLQLGEQVNLLGHRLTIAGFFDPAQVDKLRLLTGDSFLPVDSSTTSNSGSELAASDSPNALARTAELNYRHLLPGNVAIIPAALAQQFGARVTSIMLRPGDPATITSLAEQLARRSSFTVYASDGTHARSYNAAAASSTENLDRVLVPMIIAGIIILNTMLGAVSERTREIHVYTSLGLAPAHVGTLFLAEAAALGTLGVVFGYIFGQGLATILGYFHLMEGVELNYSSMSAILTMGLVLGIVMLSALWPARAAARIAAPSLQRDWKLPAAKGDILDVVLPFTVNQHAARGICAFLEEYLTTTSQAGSGRFTADNVSAFINVGDTGLAPVGAGRGLTCRVWLTPYDLGVIERFFMSICPTADANVFEIRLTLVREAGNPSTWHRLNRPFLVEIRKQFLLWRTITPEQAETYMHHSTTMFASAIPVDLPASTSLPAAGETRGTTGEGTHV